MYSLNLLPENRKEKFRLERKISLWRGALVITIVSSFVTMLGVGTMDWLLGRQLEKTTQSLVTWQALSAKRESGQVKALTEQLNTAIARLHELFHPLALHQSVIADLLSSLPESISISTAVFSPDGSFSLTGTAATRAAFLGLRTALEASPVITAVHTTSTASQRENLPFEYTGQLKIQP